MKKVNVQPYSYQVYSDGEPIGMFFLDENTFYFAPEVDNLTEENMELILKELKKLNNK